MPPYGPRRYVVRREPWPQTCTGVGDVVTDNYGQQYEVVDSFRANMIRGGTGGTIVTLHADGTIT